jgi:hypothetical protein
MKIGSLEEELWVEADTALTKKLLRIKSLLMEGRVADAIIEMTELLALTVVTATDAEEEKIESALMAIELLMRTTIDEGRAKLHRLKELSRKEVKKSEEGSYIN